MVQFDSRSPGIANFTSTAAKILPPDTKNAAELLLDLIVAALKKPWSKTVWLDPVPHQNGPHHFSILGGLLSAQRTCTIDIEPLHPEYRQICRKFQEIPTLRDSLGVDGPNYRDALFWTGQEDDRFGLTTRETQHLRHCRSYLATSTVKDCSVFLTFQKVATTGSAGETAVEEELDRVSVIEIAPGVAYAFFASLVDLDPKPFERIEKHFLESQKLIELAKNA